METREMAEALVKETFPEAPINTGNLASGVESVIDSIVEYMEASVDWAASDFWYKASGSEIAEDFFSWLSGQYAANTEEAETSYTLAVTGTVHLSFESLEDATMVSLDDRYTWEEFVEAVKCGNFETPSTELIKETV